MASESKTFISESASIPSDRSARQSSNWQLLVEIALLFGLILIVVWTPQGHLNSTVSWAALFFTIALTISSRYSPRELGLTRPFSGAVTIIVIGVLFMVLIAIAGTFTRRFGPPEALPWNRAWQYAIWALLQQFILQSFIYVRLESVVGSGRAVLLSALLFASAHVPSPLLTALSFLGALFFCEMFRRYRNIFPLGLIHAGLGLTIAASLPNSLLHHMRVGLGYLVYHR